MTYFSPQNDKLSLIYLAVSKELNIPGGVNLNNPVTRSLKPYDGDLAYDKVTGILYIGFGGQWHIAPGGGSSPCDVVVPCDLIMVDSTDIAHGNVIKNGNPFIHTFPGSASQNIFVGENAGNFAMSGGGNAGFGANALQNNAAGIDNVAVGFEALSNNTEGNNNAAVGAGALEFNTIGNDNAAFGVGALLFNTTGSANTASGSSALFNNTTGSNNTAFGELSLLNNTIGNNNTAVGQAAMAAPFTSLTGNDNAAFGANALAFTTTGFSNTALGTFAMLFNTTGFHNAAVGVVALENNTTGIQNTANGAFALFSNDTGNNNVALGFQALSGTNVPNTTQTNDCIGIGANTLTGLINGSNVIAIGSNAGINLAGAELNDIYINNLGVAGESGTIRIGDDTIHSSAYMAGIIETALSGITIQNVLIDTTTGQLGIPVSAEKYKENIQNMSDYSSNLYKLRPVLYNLKADSTKLTIPGMIANEVMEVYPTSVVRDKKGDIHSINYEHFIPMLINEVSKQEMRILKLEARIEELTKRV